MLRRNKEKKVKVGPVDPWAYPLPWRDQVRATVEAQKRFETAAGGLQAGPALDRIQPYLARVDAAVRQGAAAAQRAAVVATPQKAAQAVTVRTELADLQARGPATDDAGRRHEEALATQLRSLVRAEAVGVEASDQLRMLASRIDDAATALVELSADLSANLSGDPSGPLLTVFDEIDALHAGMIASSRAVDPAAPGAQAALNQPDAYELAPAPPAQPLGQAPQPAPPAPGGWVTPSADDPGQGGWVTPSATPPPGPPPEDRPSPTEGSAWGPPADAPPPPGPATS